MPGPDPEIDFDLLSDLDAEGKSSADIPRPLPVGHHVYSSVSGYRTVWVSPKLQPRLELLEAWAGPQCQAGAESTRWYAFPLDDEMQVMSKVFSAGVDRAGRARVCVHSIVLDRASLCAEWPGYNPLRFPGGLFLTSTARLDDEHALADSLPDTCTPASVPDSGRARVFGPDQGPLVQALLYAPRGLVLTGDHGLPAENVVTLFDWLPFPWRVRWVVGSDMLDPQVHPCQVLLQSRPPDPPADGGAGAASVPPVVASGMPLQASSPPDFPTGVWDQWLFRTDNRATRAFRHFHRWTSTLPMSSAPTPAHENWLLAAFQCLRPFEPVEEVAKDLNYQRTPQLVLGLLCLGWGDQSGSAMQRLSAFGNELIKRERFLTLSHLVEQAFQATWHRPGPMPMTEEARERHRKQSAAVADAAGPHAHVLQSIWTLLTSARSVGFAAYQSVDLPVPDLRDAVTPWDGERRSLLWMNLLTLSNETIKVLARGGESLLQSREHREAALRAANQVATFAKYRDHFDHAHQWVFNEMTGSSGTPALANGLLDLLLQKFHYPPEEIRPIRERLQRFCKLD